MRNGPSSWDIPWGCPRPSSPSCSSVCARRGSRGTAEHGAEECLKVMLIHVHHNIPQAVIGEQLGVSQLTISRAIKAMTDAIVRGPEGHAAHGRGGARGLRLSWWTASSSPTGASAITANCGRGEHGTTDMNDPDPGPARRQAGAGLRPLPGVHARRGRPGRLRTARRNRPLRMDRRQGKRRKGNDHAP